uniref:Cystatin domain-containing protein n=1 Tax=Davidia involucrata TaxID=16924 RepID=A0A5B6Z325_DAVIN
MACCGSSGPSGKKPKSHVSDSDCSSEPPEKKPKLNASDSDCDSEASEIMPEKDWEAYVDQVNASDGFDVDDFSHHEALAIITPLRNLCGESPDLEIVNKNSVFAITDYNKKHNANYELVKVVKANARVVQGVYYFITFEAKDAVDGHSKIFQAMVLDGFGLRPSEVDFCRLKPTT